jgi:hypothetical protein
MMKRFFQRVRRWYQRRFRGYVAAPSVGGSRGTAWQEHRRRDLFIGSPDANGFFLFCQCGARVDFTQENYFVRAKMHREDCPVQAVNPESGVIRLCGCPIDARYCRVCRCGLGHWIDASNLEAGPGSTWSPAGRGPK